MHVYFFVAIVGPRFLERYEAYEPLPTIFVGLGWFLCWKVTYLYWRVSMGKAGSPKEVIYKFQREKQAGKYNWKCPLD